MFCTHPPLPWEKKDDETDYYDSRRSQRRFEEDLELEARAEKRIMNAKKVLLPSILFNICWSCISFNH